MLQKININLKTKVISKIAYKCENADFTLLQLYNSSVLWKKREQMQKSEHRHLDAN